jgi:receptor protein-tyrosine kinase
MELRRYLAILRRRWLLIAACTLAGLGAAYVSTPTTTAYTTHSTIYVGSRQLPISPAGLVSNDSLLATARLTQTFAAMIHSEPIAQDALERTGLQLSAASVVGKTTVFAQKDTQLIRIVVTDAQPVVARQLANGLADAFVERVQTFEPGTPAQEGSVPALPAYVFERAKLPTVPEPIGVSRRLLLGMIFGFVIAAAVTFVLEYLDVTIKSAEDAERRLELPVLAVIPRQEGLGHLAGPESSAAPQYA